MKHSYSVTCECKRCLRERARREAQSTVSPARSIRARARQSNERGLDRWARAYYETDGGIDQFNPEDR